MIKRKGRRPGYWELSEEDVPWQWNRTGWLTTDKHGRWVKIAAALTRVSSCWHTHPVSAPPLQESSTIKFSLQGTRHGAKHLAHPMSSNSHNNSISWGYHCIYLIDGELKLRKLSNLLKITQPGKLKGRDLNLVLGLQSLFLSLSPHKLPCPLLLPYSSFLHLSFLPVFRIRR